jgi:chemotaxis protein CheX
MEDRDIQVFISSARRYFDCVDPAAQLVVEPPFIKEANYPFLEYTGIIGVSGRSRGAVCFTANSSMLINILAGLKDERTDDEARLDLVGEIANTLSGNAREEFGNNFLISVPVVTRGNHVEFSFPRDSRCYVIPLVWRSERAYLLICLE